MSAPHEQPEPESQEPVAVDAVELVRVRLPLRRLLRSAHGVEEVREVVLVRVLAADGAEGWGECSALEQPTYTGEYTDGAWALLRDLLGPALVAGRGVAVVGHPFASAAIRDARLDADLRRRGVGLAEALGGPGARDAGLRWTAVLGIGDADLAPSATAALDAGASALKLKVRPTASWLGVDRLVEALPRVPVAVDANGSFSGHEDDLVALADLLATPAAATDEPAVAPRRYVEQPLPADDLVGHAALAPRLPVPIALDESIGAPGHVAAARALGACGLVNLKPARVGGVVAAMGLLGPIATLATPPEAFLGGMLETGVGRANALAVGAALGLDATDVGPSSWYVDDDVCEPLELGTDGRMRPPPGPGIGVAPRAGRLREVTVDRLLIRR